MPLQARAVAYPSGGIVEPEMARLAARRRGASWREAREPAAGPLPPSATVTTCGVSGAGPLPPSAAFQGCRRRRKRRRIRSAAGIRRPRSPARLLPAGKAAQRRRVGQGHWLGCSPAAVSAASRPRSLARIGIRLGSVSAAIRLGGESRQSPEGTVPALK